MLQYFLNASAIWLLSLFVFDVFLRKESFHGYNRIYLLGSFIGGLIIPLISLNNDAIIYATGMSIPAEQTAVAKQTIISSPTAIDFLLTWESILMFAYLVGVAVSLLFLLKE